MELLIKKLALKARIKSPDLLTRPVGKAIFKEAKEKLFLLNIHEVLVLDFQDIGVMDSSFIDEFIITLIKNSKINDKPFYVKARNVSDANQVNIESVINSYCKFKNERIALVINELTKDNTFLIGDFSVLEHEVISYILMHKEATETELSQLMNMSVEEIKKTIEKLYAMRVIRLEDNRILAV